MRLIDLVSFISVYVLKMNRPFSNSEALQLRSTTLVGTKNSTEYNGKFTEF